MKTITKSKQFLVAIAALFSNTTTAQKQATFKLRSRISFRSRFKRGYATQDPYKLH
jgi:hypothetical protein